ncbi:MAG: hypothetical protein ACRDKH_07835 [Solirubrobacterales bacterium]
MSAGIEPHTRPLRARIATIAALALLGAGLLTAGTAVAPGDAAAQSCGLPSGLSPVGSGPTRFTMLLRINTGANIDAYTDPAHPVSQGGFIGNRVRPQDIFVLNTRFLGNLSGTEPPMTPTVAAELALELKTAFPCNRIIGLTGMSPDPFAAGYSFSLFDSPYVYALLTDFEPMDWDDDPTRGPWNYKYKTALKRIKKLTATMNTVLSTNAAGSTKQSGLAPIDRSTWNFGEIAQVLDKRNRRLGGRKLGPLSVQTQDVCANEGATGYRSRLKALFDQYRFKSIRKKVKRGGKVRKVTIRRKLKKKARPDKANLAVQLSFSHNPTGSGMAITRTSPAIADTCISAGLKKGAGAFFFFASTEAMSQLFLQPRMAGLRPPAFKAPRN